MAEFVENYLDPGIKNNSDLEVVRMGITKCKAGDTRNIGKHYFHALFFVTSGSGKLFIDNNEFSLCSGSVFYIPADVPARYSAAQTNPWEYSWIAFTGSRSAGFRYSFFSISSHQYVLNNINTQLYYDIIRKSESLRPDVLSSYFFSNSILLEVFAELSRECSFGDVPQGVSSLAVKAKRVIDRDYHIKVQIQQIAADLGVHPYYLSRVFKDSFGISPKKYLMNCKFSKAEDQLSMTDLSVSDISSSLGFDDQLSFSKAFKMHSGYSPTDFRKKYRKKTNK